MKGKDKVMKGKCKVMNRKEGKMRKRRNGRIKEGGRERNAC